MTGRSKVLGRRGLERTVGAVLLGVLIIAASAGAQNYHPPLEAYVDTSDFPQDLLTPADGSSPGQRLRVKDFNYSEITITEPATGPRDIGAMIVSDILVDESFIFNIPGLESAFSIEIGAAEFHVEVTALGERLADLPTGTAGVDGVVDVPFRAEITATSFPISLLLNPEFFQPMEAIDGTYVHVTVEDGEEVDPAKLTITLGDDMTLVVQHTWDGETEIFFDTGSGPSSFPTLGPLDVAVMLGETGVVLDIGSIIFDFSDEANPSGVTGGPTWNGIVIESAKVAFVDIGLESAGTDNPLTTDEPGLTLSLENFQIGTGGFSGTIAGTGLNLPIGLSGMDVTLDSMSLQFTRNVLTGGGMGATIQNFPFFDGNVLAMQLALDMSGNFTIGLAAPGDGSELVKLSVASVLDFHVQSAYFERRVDPEVFLVGLNGKADLLFMQTGADPPSVDINGLTITSAGEVSLQGGWLTLSEKAGIDFNGFGITLSQVGFGRTDPNASTGTDPPQSWIGFTGGVKLVDGLGAEAEMQRLQFLWPKQGSGVLPFVDVKLDGIKVAFEQPNVVRFEGFVEWFETAGGDAGPAAEGFAGKLQLDLLALNMTMQSRIVIGKATSPQEFAFFFLDMEMQLPTGIPLGQSGVSIYGFLGLLAYNMEPNLTPFESPVKWVNAFRKTNNVVVQQTGDDAATWAIRNGALGFGAGIILGTTPDDGFAVNAKIALTIAVPGPVVMLTGQANVLKARTDLASSTNPLFVAVALFDGRESIFVVNIGVFYDLAKVIKVSGEAEAFFDLDNPANWHIYLGQRDPESRRITADVLSLFKATSYYMIEPSGIGFGAKVKYGRRWKYGPLKVVLEAWFGYDAGVSWRPIHAWGEVDLGGQVELSACGVGVGLSARAELEMHAPKRYLLAGKFHVKLNLPWPVPDPKATVTLRWESHRNARPEPLLEVLNVMTLHARKEEWTFRPKQVSHTVAGNGTINWPSEPIQRTQLADPDNSIPAPGESLVDGAAAALPMVPLDSFASLRFKKSVNDVANLGLGNAYNAGDPHKDIIDEKLIRYDAKDVTLAHAFKGSGSSFDLTDEITLLGNWPAIPFTQDEPADNTLDLLSKNGFRYYNSSTYLGYAEDGDGWKDWIAGHYGLLYCLDGMDPKQLKILWAQYQYSARPVGQTTAVSSGASPPPYSGATASFQTMRRYVGEVPTHVDCPLDLDWLEEEDFVLPPYNVFQLTFEGAAHGGMTSAPYRKYGNSIAFHTEGPPLALDDYVRTTVPEFAHRPYYRDHNVGIQFNENYMNKLYREDDQFFQLQILDENEEPIAGTITTAWDESASFSLSESELAWYGLMVALGAVDPANIARDDLVHATVNTSGAVHPGERHLVRTWLEDPRLGNDRRLDADSEGWRERNGVRYFDQNQNQVVLHEFGFTASRYLTFPDLFQQFTNGGSEWFTLPVHGDPNTVLSAGNPLNRDFIDGSASVLNGNHDTIGIFLRHLLSPRTPDELTTRTLHDYVRRTPGYADDITLFSVTDLAAVAAVWNDAMQLFERLDQTLGLNRAREPLPEQVEVYVLDHAGTRVGLLIEFPEAIDPSRIDVSWSDPQPRDDDVLVVPNPSNDRFFLFLMEVNPFLEGSGRPEGVGTGRGDSRVPDSVGTGRGDSRVPVRRLVDGTHSLRFEFHLKLSDQNPRYYTDPLVDSEVATITLQIPNGEFSLEASP